MEYSINKDDNNVVIITLSGRLDTVTTPELEKELEEEKDQLDTIEKLAIDMKNLKYISSAGLRLLLRIQKAASASNKEFEIYNANDFVLEVFEMTGFKDILTIK